MPAWMLGLKAIEEPARKKSVEEDISRALIELMIRSNDNKFPMEEQKKILDWR